VPAAAVTPAPQIYANTAAVKKLVVEINSVLQFAMVARKFQLPVLVMLLGELARIAVCPVLVVVFFVRVYGHAGWRVLSSFRRGLNFRLFNV